MSSHERFDLTDGPNATRTGEVAVIRKRGRDFAFIDVHWDHQSELARTANANETAAEANLHVAMPTVVPGDFNTGCQEAAVNSMAGQASMSLIVSAGIDCIFARDLTGQGSVLGEETSPSDHPIPIAELSL